MEEERGWSISNRGDGEGTARGGGSRWVPEGAARGNIRAVFLTEASCHRWTTLSLSISLNSFSL